MLGSISLVTIGVIFLIVFFGGLVKGTAGFGYAIVGTVLLTTILEPSTAVVIMILPMLIANVSLVFEFSWTDLKVCLARFWPYLSAAVGGSILGMALLQFVPKTLLAFLLGGVTLGYVFLKQPWIDLPSGWFETWCLHSGVLPQGSLGLISGVVFGASNIGIQIVMYVDALSLERTKFVAMLSLIMVGVSSVRVGTAWFLGLYDGSSMLVLSAIAGLPGFVGVSIGSSLRQRVPESYLTSGVLLLLTLIGVRLLSMGINGL